MKISEYFKAILTKQKSNIKIYKNSHCDKCLEHKNISIVYSGTDTIILCKKCKEVSKGE